MKHFFPVIFAASVLFLTACSDYVGKENTHPLFNKGMTSKTGRNYNEAVKAFEEFLMMCPKSAKTHYELATIYSDYLNDYVFAIYHYRKYAELSHLSRNDADAVQKFIEDCKRRAYEQFQEENSLSRSPETPADPSVVAALKTERDALRNMLKSHIDNEKALLQAKKSLEAQLETMKKAGSPSSLPTAKSAALKNNSPAQSASPVKPSVDTYKVQSGDTFIQISRKVYGSGKHYRLIIKENSDLVGADGTRLRTGQVLRIPVLPAKKP